MKKQLYLGKDKDTNEKVFVTVEIENGVLTISGVVGARSNGHADSCGQIYPIKLSTFAEGWTNESINSLNAVWGRWHLNDMKAGTKKQETAVKEYMKSHKYDYSEVCEYLKEIGLYEDNGYRYGSAWLKEELSNHVYTWFNKLPETTELPPSVWRD